VITVHPFGDYSHRQPLAYPAIRSHVGDVIAVSRDMAAADLVIVAHSKDLERHGLALRQRLRPDQRLVLLSEEPLWDTVWAPTPLRRAQVHMTAAGRLPYVFLNHHSSTIFDFDRIPYFLLTEHAFFPRYARWFARNGARTPEDWARHFEQTEFDIGFIAEYRDGAEFDATFPAAGIYGLGKRRTEIALACTQGRVLRTGAGWNRLPRRQSLPDWHLEKFLDYDHRIRLLSAIENTHQDNYVSEKIFDSFAMGAVPLYIAGPLHRVSDLAPSGSWLNLVGLSPADAAARIGEFRISDRFLTRYATAQRALADLFASPGALVAEHDRLRRALVRELGACLTG